MSFNREGVVWKTGDGMYRYGQYKITWVGSEADGYDPEWDCEYDYDSFEWVGPKRATEEAAYRAWSGANPGGYNGSVDTPEATRVLDRMAAEYDKRPRARSATLSSPWHSTLYFA